MRLNFSGSGEEDIREGVRRIGSVITEQVELYEKITDEHPKVGGRAQAGKVEPEESAATVLPLRKRR